jgi:hypothetical protein
MAGIVQVAEVEPTTEPTLALIVAGTGVPPPPRQVINPDALTDIKVGLLLRHVAVPVKSRDVLSE